jgi:hypothetical protein
MEMVNSMHSLGRIDSRSVCSIISARSRDELERAKI